MSNSDDKGRAPRSTEIKVAIIAGVFALLGAIITVVGPRVMDAGVASPPPAPGVTPAPPGVTDPLPPTATRAPARPRPATATPPAPPAAPASAGDADLSGAWSTQFVLLDVNKRKEYADYTLLLTQNGKVISGQVSVRDPADADCAYGFIVRGERSATTPVTVELSEIGYVAPLSCRFYSALSMYKDYRLTYDSSGGAERLVGEWAMRSPDRLYGETAGPVEFAR